MSLKNKTVILATHDFDTVIDLVYVKGKNKYQISAKYLTNSKGFLSEQNIDKSDICSIIINEKANIKDEPIKILKLVHARKVLDLLRNGENLEFLVWNYVSSSLHLCPKPNKIIFQNGDKKRINLTNSEIKKCEQYLLDEFQIEIDDYENFISQLTLKKLVNIYKKRSSNYSKMNVYRLILNKLNIKSKKERHRETIFNKFINETYHLENDRAFCLNPLKFEKIPNYLIDICNEHVNVLAESIETK